MYHDCTTCLMYEIPSACAACHVTQAGEFTGYRGAEDPLPDGCLRNLPREVHALIIEMWGQEKDKAKLAQLINMLRLLGHPDLCW